MAGVHGKFSEGRIYKHSIEGGRFVFPYLRKARIAQSAPYLHLDSALLLAYRAAVYVTWRVRSSQQKKLVDKGHQDGDCQDRKCNHEERIFEPAIERQRGSEPVNKKGPNIAGGLSTMAYL
jgi:hypothetical protein